jgi:hypothetical protein
VGVRKRSFKVYIQQQLAYFDLMEIVEKLGGEIPAKQCSATSPALAKLMTY